MPQSSPAGTDPRTAAARWCAALLMAQFVSGRAVRDALYLANLPVTTLPTAMLVTLFPQEARFGVASRCPSPK